MVHSWRKGVEHAGTIGREQHVAEWCCRDRWVTAAAPGLEIIPAKRAYTRLITPFSSASRGMHQRITRMLSRRLFEVL
jgi:hypothetical protein